MHRKRLLHGQDRDGPRGGTGPRDDREKHRQTLVLLRPSDPWCPVQYYKDMVKAHPKADIRLCDNEFDHAFVLESSIGMGDGFCEITSTEIT